MKRYMIKARSDMSPVKEKLKTALLREEVEERKKTAEEQGRKESEDKNWEEDTDVPEVAIIEPREDTSPKDVLGKNSPARTPQAQASAGEEL